jgi:broad specificity phosphatase PhoE
MEAPAIRRYRRPFLAPLWLTFLIVLLGALALGAAWRSATTTVVVLVHPIEKDPGTIDDPPLSAEGEERAQRLAQLLGGAAGPTRVDSIYVSDDRRARRTAAPLSERLHRTPQVFTAAEARATAARALRDNAGGTVVIVASDATLPQMLRELGGEQAAGAAPADADILYIVSVPTFGHAHQLRLKY